MNEKPGNQGTCENLKIRNFDPPKERAASGCEQKYNNHKTTNRALKGRFQDN